MPNKKIWERYQVIHEVFIRFSRKYSLQELLELVNEKLLERYGDKACIEIRQLRTDLENMEAFPIDAPIIKEGKRKSPVYYYEDRNWKLTKLPSEIQEMNFIQEMARMVKQIRSLRGVTAEWTSAIDNFCLRMNYPNEPHRNIVSFESAAPPEGMVHFKTLYDAIKKCKTLTLEYKAFQAEAQKVVIHPYLLKEYKNRFYLLAHTEERNDYRVYALDRIIGIRGNRTKYKYCPLSDPNDYFKEVIGVAVYKNEEAKPVLLKFSALMAPYVKGCELHHSQEVIDELPDGSIIARYHLRKNPELVTTIFSFLDYVEVLGHDELREEIISITEKILRKYKSEEVTLSGKEEMFG
jgi:predicted DNA-binding transcriptional regulator YafY